MTAREKYDVMIRDEIGPWLRERRFKKRRNRFRRCDDAGWQVVDFQASQWGSRDDVRFTINLWVGVTELMAADAAWHVQERIGGLIAAGEDRWWSLGAATDTVRLGGELRVILDDPALPWLEARGSLDQLVALARKDPDHFPSYALRRFSMLLARAGYDELANEMAALDRERDLDFYGW